MKELIKKIKEFEEKSGLKIYEEILGDLGKMDQQLKRLRESRDNWKKKHDKLKDLKK